VEQPEIENQPLESLVENSTEPSSLGMTIAQFEEITKRSFLKENTVFQEDEDPDEDFEVEENDSPIPDQVKILDYEKNLRGEPPLYGDKLRELLEHSRDPLFPYKSKPTSEFHHLVVPNAKFVD